VDPVGCFVEVDRVGIPAAELEGGFGFRGVGETVQVGEVRGADLVLEATERSAGIDRGELRWVAEQGAAHERVVSWFVDRGVPAKGHPLTWHTLAPSWLLDLPAAEVVEALRARIEREVSGFAGLIDVWDVVNEAVIMPVFRQEDNGITRASREIGRIGLIATAFEHARASNPSATLLLNDFDMSTAFECLLEGVLEAGIEVDAIGLQSHMHQGYWGEEKTLETLERFARYGLPLHLTETTLVSGHLMPAEIVDLNDYQVDDWPSTPEGEERQADELVRHYRTLLSHPSVEAITYWGLTDRGAWLGAPAGLAHQRCRRRGADPVHVDPGCYSPAWPASMPSAATSSSITFSPTRCSSSPTG
jgi:GH35 family endo-1,4-beta-xylanase